MAEERSDTYKEEYYRVALGQGLYTAELSTNIPDGYSSVCYNFIATGDSVENRSGMKRSSVEWNTWIEYIAGPSINTALDRFYEISPWSGDSSRPAFIWASSGYDAETGGAALGTTLNLVRASGAIDANDGFMSVSIPSACSGVCQYNGSIYFLLNTGVQKITAINWATDSLTYSAIASGTISGLRGLITFKDRLWAFSGSRLYYTDLPPVGGQPETWAAATNFVQVVGPGGSAWILQVVPLGNKLIIFTTIGLFTLLVEGEPASWILRVLDSKSISTSFQTAFESKGVVYYVNTEGVWATNGLRVSKMSAVIDDQFWRATGARVHTITHYEDGMIVSIVKLAPHSSGTPRYADHENCVVLYSKLDPVCWTQWDVGEYEKAEDDFSLIGIHSTTGKIPTYLNNDPIVYIMALTSRGTTVAARRTAAQLLVFDGGKDEYMTASTVVIDQVQLFLQTKHFDAGNQFNLKKSKRGMIEMFTSDTEHRMTSSWNIDATESFDTEEQLIITEDFSVGLGSNLIQFKADFFFRRASLNLRTFLQGDDSQIKIKDIAVAIDVGRNEFERVR